MTKEIDWGVLHKIPEKMDKHYFTLEVLEDCAPEQFAEAGSYMMIYKVLMDNEVILSTEDYSPKELSEIALNASKWFERFSKWIRTKEYDGNRCD